MKPKRRADGTIYWDDGITRFLSNTEKGPNCWVWTASVDSSGYGHLMWFGKCAKAHRVSFEIHRHPIPLGTQVLHHCDNRRCVNPDHLFLGSNQDNVDDRTAKGRNRPLRGAAHQRSKLTEAQVAEIRTASGKHRDLAAIYGVSKTLITRIKARQVWRHI